MNNKLLNLTIFVVGIAVGGFASMKYFEKKYGQIAEEEISSVRSVLSRKYGNAEESSERSEETIVMAPESSMVKPDLNTYANMVRKINYSQFSTEGKQALQVEEPEMCATHRIHPDEFGEEDGYDTCTLMYYADKVLCDDFDELVENPDWTIGVENLEYFGEFEAGTVFVRNDRLKMDYEICLDLRNYADVTGGRP